MEIADVKEAMEQDTGISTISDSALSSVKMASVNEQKILKDPAVSDQSTKNVLSTFGGQSGPLVWYICSDGLQLKEEIISVC